MTGRGDDALKIVKTLHGTETDDNEDYIEASILFMKSRV